MEDFVLDRFESGHSTSTGAVTADVGVCLNTVWSVLHEEGIQPFHMKRVHCLNKDHYPRRLECVREMLRIRTKLQFLALVSFTDEASFITEGISTFEINTSGCESYPHFTALHKYQEGFSLNVRAGIVGYEVVSSYLLQYI